MPPDQRERGREGVEFGVAWEGPGRVALLADEGRGMSGVALGPSGGGVRGRDLDGQLEGDVHLSLLSQRDDFRKLHNLQDTRERKRDDTQRETHRERHREE